MKKVIDTEDKFISQRIGDLSIHDTDIISSRIEGLIDIYWRLQSEIFDNIKKIQSLTALFGKTLGHSALEVFKKINSVFKSIDRIEVRGRDSAGLSLLFILKEADFKQ